MVEKYFAELEPQWRHNNKTSGLKAIFNWPYPPALQRPKSLRGPDFAQELIRLAAITGDPRFADALCALIDRRIIGRNFNFLPWELPRLKKGQKDFELRMCAAVHMSKAKGLSLRRACAELAAETGWPAMSFAAATKDVELIYRRHLVVDRQLDPDEYKLLTDVLKCFMTPAEAAAFEARLASRSTGLPTAELMT